MIPSTSESDVKENDFAAPIVEEKHMKLVKLSDIKRKCEVEETESFDRMKLIKENLFLLSEIDKLKQTNNSLLQRVYYLESFKRVSAKKT